MGHFAHACPRSFEDPEEDEDQVSVTVAGTSGVDAPLSSSGKNRLSLFPSALTSAVGHDIVAADDSQESVSAVPPPTLPRRTF